MPEAVAALEHDDGASGALGLVDADGLALLVPRPSSATVCATCPNRFATSTPPASTSACSPRWATPRSTYRHDAAATAAHVDKGTVDAAVLLRAGHRRPDPRRGRRRRADAAEDDVLRAEAAHRAWCSAASICDRTPVEGVSVRQLTSQVAPDASSAREVAGALALDRAHDLALHLVLVGRRATTSRNTPIGVGIVGAYASRDSANASAGCARVLVVHEELVLADVGHVHDLALAELVEHHAALAVVAEADRLAVAAAR